ncbi:MAG: DNA polymerase III subunit delta [Acidobacteria bacterium]|nr:DNA polymerase III subunit delta [Acidobacteriota bacterium]MBV9438084.1 DNA polymerase III subunit delta [Acidobacteriota bacterium]
MAGRSFAATERFVSDVSARKLQAAYVLVGDEAFFRDQCRAALIQHLVTPELRDFSLHDLDLAENSVAEILDLARTPSLMAPFQVFFVRGVKSLYGRGSHQEEFAAIEEYCKNPNPDAVMIFVADHISIPADARRMEMQDKDRYQRIRDTLGEFCTVIELARVDESDGMRWVTEHAGKENVKVDADAARELVDALGADMMLVSNELEKLILYVGEKKRITIGDVETLVLAAKQRSLYELTDAISAKDRVRALSVLDALMATEEGEEASIGHIYMLSRTFRQMLVILEKNVRDSRAIWQALWQGFRLPPFAADDVIRQARRYKSRRELTRALRLLARADLALRSSPVSKRLVLEKLVLDLCEEPQLVVSQWNQEELRL